VLSMHLASVFLLPLRNVDQQLSRTVNTALAVPPPSVEPFGPLVPARTCARPRFTVGSTRNRQVYRPAASEVATFIGPGVSLSPEYPTTMERAALGGPASCTDSIWPGRTHWATWMRKTVLWFGGGVVPPSSTSGAAVGEPVDTGSEGSPEGAPEGVASADGAAVREAADCVGVAGPVSGSFGLGVCPHDTHIASTSAKRVSRRTVQDPICSPDPPRPPHKDERIYTRCTERLSTADALPPYSATIRCAICAGIVAGLGVCYLSL
jgi:hypothetical protein